MVAQVYGSSIPPKNSRTIDDKNDSSSNISNKDNTP